MFKLISNVLRYRRLSLTFSFLPHITNNAGSICHTGGNMTVTPAAGNTRAWFIYSLHVKEPLQANSHVSDNCGVRSMKSPRGLDRCVPCARCVFWLSGPTRWAGVPTAGQGFTEPTAQRHPQAPTVTRLLLFLGLKSNMLMKTLHLL